MIDTGHIPCNYVLNIFHGFVYQPIRAIVYVLSAIKSNFFTYSSVLN
jgi:hypothetical protein